MTPPRTPAIATAPTKKGQSHGDTRLYTEYKPDSAKRVRDDVMSYLKNGSFISRTLGVITRNGTSKHFETISGLDGLTCGIKDFATDSGVLTLFKILHAADPVKFDAAFGSHAKDVLSLSWITQHNAGGKGVGADDAGLVTLEWLRVGLDTLLADPALRPAQLAAFRDQTAEPCHQDFLQRGFTLEFSLATMIAIANSTGASGVRKRLDEIVAASNNTGLALERAAIQTLLTGYVGTSNAANKALLEDGFAGTDPKLMKESSGLNHRGRRAFELFQQFPYAAEVLFTSLGEFSTP